MGMTSFTFKRSSIRSAFSKKKKKGGGEKVKNEMLSNKLSYNHPIHFSDNYKKSTQRLFYFDKSKGQ